MSVVFLVVIAVAALFLLGLIAFITRRTSKLNRDFFRSKWQSVEVMSQTKATWFQSIIEGDKLLDEALKQLRYSGKTTAERMVSANRVFSDADGVWSAHKIRNKVVHETNFKLKKSHVNACLSGFKKALKDLGAM